MASNRMRRMAAASRGRAVGFVHRPGAECPDAWQWDSEARFMGCGGCISESAAHVAWLTSFPDQEEANANHDPAKCWECAS